MRLYWLPLGAAAVNAAVVGLPAGLPAHVPRQLYGHASLCAPLNGCTFLLLTFAVWIREGKKHHNVFARNWRFNNSLPEMLNGSDRSSEQLLLNTDSARLLKCVILLFFFYYASNPLISVHSSSVNCSLAVTMVAEEAVAYLSVAQTSILFLK